MSLSRMALSSSLINGKKTWYVRDASGNVMAIYENGNSEINSGHLSQVEVDLYGSSRLGLWKPNRDVQATGWDVLQLTPAPGTSNGIASGKWIRGETFFELSNHLGNVLATILDRKIGVDGGAGNIDHYTADVASASDYYPFGMQMPDRKFSSGAYRYGFNGKEKDIEGNVQYDYGFRIYDPRLGRFKSIDPIAQEFPWNSPYSYSEGDPINFVDLDGLEQNSTRSTITSSPTLPELSNFSVNRSGVLINNTQLINGPINSGAYGPQMRPITAAEFDAMICPGCGFDLDGDGKGGVVWNSNGSWHISLLKKADPPKQFSWLDRAVMRLQAEQQELFTQPYPKWNVNSGFYEQITTDPSKLTNDYLNEVNKRLLIGNGTDQDNLYASEVAKRKEAGKIVDPASITFIQGRGETAKKITALIPEGYKRTKLKSQGQAVYTNGKFWITPDQDGHQSGAIWKKFDKEKNVGSTDKSKRVGTFGRDLNHGVAD